VTGRYRSVASLQRDNRRCRACAEAGFHLESRPIAEGHAGQCAYLYGQAPGVVEAELYLSEGETIRPVRLDIDRRGYVLAIGKTSGEALEHAEEAARLLRVAVE